MTNFFESSVPESQDGITNKTETSLDDLKLSKDLEELSNSANEIYESKLNGELWEKARKALELSTQSILRKANIDSKMAANDDKYRTAT